MTLAAITVVILAGALRTRLGRLKLRAGNVLGDAGSRVLDHVKPI